METENPELIIEIAKDQLGLSKYTPSFQIPKTYLKELKHHVGLYPNDTNFTVSLQPNTGFGAVTCLEPGCNKVTINLVRRLNVSDGGRKEGLGSLSAYRAHIVNSETHIKSRDARIKAQKKQDIKSSLLTSTSAETKPTRSSLLSLNLLGSARSVPQTPVASSSGVTLTADTKPVLHSSRGSSTISREPSFNTPMKSEPKEHSLARYPRLPVKSEPIELPVPRKRPSEIDLSRSIKKEEQRAMNELLGTPPSSKKMKYESPKTPLAQMNRNQMGNHSTSTQDSRIKQLDLLIANEKASLDCYSRKARKSAMDIRRIASIRRNITRCEREKIQHRILSTLDSPPRTVPGSSSIPSLKSVEERKPVVTNPSPVASGSNIRINNVVKPEPKISSVPPVPSVLPNALPSALPHIPPHIPIIQDDADDDHYDGDGDFYGRGKDRFAGPVASREDLSEFLLNAGAEHFDGNATVADAVEKLGLKNQFTPLPGMKITLLAHQIIGVAWMVEKENGTFQGGCLADEMGLGKTVQMMSVIVTNRSKDPACKTNLILAPTALLDQWKLELETKTDCDLKCLIYHGSNKPRKKADLMKYDVVLTTYQTMALEWPDFEAADKAAKRKAKKSKNNSFLASDSEDDRSSKKKKKQELGLLFQMEWYRIVLDEAQNIRNRRTRNSRAVSRLSSTYRWCLTGTPIINSLTDVYAMIRFLEIRPWYDWDEFNSYISRREKREPGLVTARLQAIMATFVLRRKKDSMLDGKRLIELPPKEVNLLKLEFSPEELTIYKMVEVRSQATFNRYLRTGTVLKNYAQVLVLLLRLRQVCAHPCLIQEDGVALIALDEHAEERSPPEIRDELSRARELVSPKFVSKMKEKLKQTTLSRMEKEKESADATIDDEECPICFDMFNDAVVTACSHLFCRECIASVLNNPATEDHEAGQHKAHERPCPVCRSAISHDRLFSRAAFEPTDAELNGEEPEEDIEDLEEEPEAPRAKGKARAVRKKRKSYYDSEDEYEDEDDMSDFIVQSDEDEEEKDARRTLKKRLGKHRANVVLDSDDDIGDEDPEIIFGAKPTVNPTLTKEQIKLLPKFLPSTKMKKMMEKLREWSVGYPEEKTLIISQWTQCLELVSNYLTEEGFVHVKYIGSMNRKKRDQAVRAFMQNEKAKVMLMSLKCGGVGLNLTRANRVISLDLGWSEAIESQAFDRVHRLGQMRNVEVNRLVISNTVEDRILALQERKKNLADGSLGEGNGKKLGRLSVRELANLFNLNAQGNVINAY